MLKQLIPPAFIICSPKVRRTPSEDHYVKRTVTKLKFPVRTILDLIEAAYNNKVIESLRFS